MTPERFNQLAAEGYNHIPVLLHTMADFETPLSVYMKLAAGPYSYLLESAHGGEQWGRYSFIGLAANKVLKVHDGEVSLYQGGELLARESVDDPLDYIEDFQKQYKTPVIPGLPRFIGGLVGYFGYDVVRYTERSLKATVPKETLSTPDIVLMESNEVIVFDGLTDRITLVKMTAPSTPDAYQNSLAYLKTLQEKLQQSQVSLPKTLHHPPKQPAEITFEFKREDFLQAVERIVDYTLAGDVMQVVLAQRMNRPFELPPIDLYRALRTLNPSPYMFFIDFDDFHLVSSTPEIMARVEDGVVTSRPLAGTRPRGSTPEKDRQLEQELLSDPKELAEHLMLIDLSRNDVGRVSVAGSVKLVEKMTVERYSHVMHISSHVTGRLLPGQSALDVLRATLPVGTLSGAPKVRAMEIIDELESVKRGIYGGAVGYLSWNGNMDTAIAIRTAILKDNVLYIQAGAGVVADSVADKEWKECLDKAQAVFQAADLAESLFELDLLNQASGKES